MASFDRFRGYDYGGPAMKDLLGARGASGPLVLLSIACSLLIGCGRKPDPIPCGEALLEDIGDVTYTADIQPLLDTYCTTCHSRSATGSERNLAPDGANFDDFNSSLLHFDDIVTRVAGGNMPPGAFAQPSQRERCVFIAWDNQGFPE